MESYDLRSEQEIQVLANHGSSATVLELGPVDSEHVEVKMNKPLAAVVPVAAASAGDNVHPNLPWDFPGRVLSQNLGYPSVLYCRE